MPKNFKSWNGRRWALMRMQSAQNHYACWLSYLSSAGTEAVSGLADKATAGWRRGLQSAGEIELVAAMLDADVRRRENGLMITRSALALPTAAHILQHRRSMK